MAQQLQIQIDGTALDLLPGEETRFFVTKQIHDILKGLATRESDFTRQISLPRTTKNIELLKAARANIFDRSRNDYLPCVVLMNGINVVNDGQLLVSSTSKTTINASIFGGANSFFSQLSEFPLNTLDWSEYDFEWTIPSFTGLAGQPAGLTTASCVFTDNFSLQIAEEAGLNLLNFRTNYLNLQWGGFWFYVKTALEKIFDNLNDLTVDFSALDSDFEKLAFANPVNKYLRAAKLPPGFAGSGTGFVVQDLAQLAVHHIVPDNFDDPGGLWTAGGWQIPTPGLVIIRTTIEGTILPRPAGSTFDTGIRVIAAGNIIATRVIQDRESGIGEFFSESIVTSFTAEAGDLVKIEIVTGASSVVPDLIKVHLLSNFVSVEREGETDDRFINIAEYMPAISQKDFVLNVLKWFHIVAVEVDRVVYLKYWDEIPTKPAKLVKSPANDDFNTSSLLANYGQNNMIRYAVNDFIQRQDLDTTFIVDSDALDPLKVVIDLSFSGTDVYDGLADRLAPPFFGYTYEEVDNNKMSISAAQVYTTIDANDLEAGDLIFVDAQLLQVATVLNSRSGTIIQDPGVLQDLDWEFVHYSELSNTGLHVGYMELDTVSDSYLIADGAVWTVSPINFNKAIFPAWLAMEGLLNRYFSRLVSTLERPLVLQVWLDLQILEFIVLDSTEPIHIESFASDFYINKIEQFKVKGLVRFELVRI